VQIKCIYLCSLVLNIEQIFFFSLQTIKILSELYSNVNEVDLFVGAMGERSSEGALLGPTFVCLVGDQFARLRRGDRFYYEEANQPSSFSQGKNTDV
jgi:hypothetical protein